MSHDRWAAVDRYVTGRLLPADPVLDAALPALAAEGGAPFDLVFLDADKESAGEHLRWALELTTTGGVIVADNVVRDGALADAASHDLRVRGARAVHERLAAEPRVRATTIHTVGAKGYDGFTLALVTA